MATIEKEKHLFTLINVFTVEPHRQAALVNLLVEATEKVIRHLPGFVSANIHQSKDGKRVVNYAQWATKADFEEMQRSPLAIQHMEGAASLASFDPILCDVVDCVDNESDEPPTTTLNSIDESRFLEFLSKQYQVPAINLGEFDLSADVIALVPRELALKYHVIPANRAGRTLILAMSDPTHTQAISEVRKHTGFSVETVVTSDGEIMAALQRYYPVKR